MKSRKKRKQNEDGYEDDLGVGKSGCFIDGLF